MFFHIHIRDLFQNIKIIPPFIFSRQVRIINSPLNNIFEQLYEKLNFTILRIRH